MNRERAEANGFPGRAFAGDAKRRSAGDDAPAGGGGGGGGGGGPDAEAEAAED